MSVSILYYKVSPERMSSAKLSEQIADWVKELPKIKQKQVKRLRQQNDQLLSLAGLQLLKIGISEVSGKLFTLDQLRFPEKAKPFLAGNIDFNISHSGDVVCCVISDSTKVGIDLELQRNVTPATMNKFLDESVDSLDNTPNKSMKYRFFDIWTKNEAIIKAANHGSIYNMHDIQHEKAGGYYQNHFWYTYPVDIVPADDNNEYTCHIACSEQIDVNDIKYFTAKQIHNL